MKNLILSAFALLFIVSCDSNDNDSNPEQGSNKINLKATVESGSLTKAGPINSNFTTDFPIGIYAYNTAWLSGTSANTINNDQATVAGATGHAITFGSGPYYYPSDGSNLHFFAFAPRATETTPAGAGTSPVVTHTITGQEDVMWASATGQKIGSAAASNPILAFNHKLTQLQFTFKSDATYPATGNKVTSLTVNAQPSTVVMNVETGVCTFSGSAAMQALSTTNQTAGINITTAGTNANSPVMTSPNTSYTLNISVLIGSTTVNYTNIPVTLTTLASNAHMITLTFTATAVTATATVAPWVTGTGGNVSVL